MCCDDNYLYRRKQINFLHTAASEWMQRNRETYTGRQVKPKLCHRNKIEKN